MNKEEKAAVVERLTEELKGAEAIFAIDYRGISVPQAAELRSGLREAGASFRVVKNRLTLRAADAAGAEDIKDYLTGPTALTLVDGDVALAAKTITRLGGEWELLSYKGGVMGDSVLDPDGFQAIAKLPGREQLNAQFAGIVASPLTGLVRGLGSMIQGLALQLGQIAEQGLVGGEAPADAPSEDSGPEAAEGSDPDPDPQESSEEGTGEQEAPEGEEAELETGDSGTGEGDQDLGEEPGEDAEQTEPPSEENAEAAETSDQTSSEESLEQKEEGD